jgi:hypothetical protein
MITISLGGCGEATPNCSDEKTISLVKEITAKKLSTVEYPAKIIYDFLKIDSSRASAFDEKIKKYTCEAQLTVASKDAEEKGFYVPITYESQLDDNKKLVVEMYTPDNLFGISLFLSRAILESEQ